MEVPNILRMRSPPPALCCASFWYYPFYNRFYNYNDWYQSEIKAGEKPDYWIPGMIKFIEEHLSKDASDLILLYEDRHIYAKGKMERVVRHCPL
jgi:hypothetical protein